MTENQYFGYAQPLRIIHSEINSILYDIDLNDLCGMTEEHDTTIE
jgi:hypothetical protein